MDEASTSLPTPEPEGGCSDLGKQRSGRGRRTALRSIIGVLVVAALAVLVSTVTDLRQQVDNLESEVADQNFLLQGWIRDTQWRVDSLERQVSGIDGFETYVTERELDSKLGSIQDDVDDLNDLNELICGRSCVLVDSFYNVDFLLIDLTRCVNEFIDAWSSNGRTSYC
jgi:hypothetical protein